ncbi:hypothetical protein KVR01_009205 [Diaporthe batatas]|uniref:uncharacterized protein n=1 Tax=Diaporthe batatas TaxID=748121 RepID=UPI001D03B1DA|nr:uncharacterized protein KVR01_009205 [Diaporthe batatas]KAG8160941.1 hypothetical protein KVR01_009205 [Diaporthe batatas]
MSSSSGNSFPPTYNGVWNSNQRFQPMLFTNAYQGPYLTSPQQQYWGNQNIMQWIPRPASGGWSPIYPPSYYTRRY